MSTHCNDLQYITYVFATKHAKNAMHVMFWLYCSNFTILTYLWQFVFHFFTFGVKIKTPINFGYIEGGKRNDHMVIEW